MAFPDRIERTVEMVESGFAQLPDDAYRTAYDANMSGWPSELSELVGYLDDAA